MGAHEQTGLPACFSRRRVRRGLIKKHEKTRKDKEDDRTRHMLELRAQTGVVFLTYRAVGGDRRPRGRACAGAAALQVHRRDGVEHTIWRVDRRATEPLVDAFAALPALYIADGHHRAASAARAHGDRRRRRPTADACTFIAVAFPETRMQHPAVQPRRRRIWPGRRRRRFSRRCERR